MCTLLYEQPCRSEDVAAMIIEQVVYDMSVFYLFMSDNDSCHTMTYMRLILASDHYALIKGKQLVQDAATVSSYL